MHVRRTREQVAKTVGTRSAPPQDGRAICSRGDFFSKTQMAPSVELNVCESAQTAHYALRIDFVEGKIVQLAECHMIPLPDHVADTHNRHCKSVRVYYDARVDSMIVQGADGGECAAGAPHARVLHPRAVVGARAVSAAAHGDLLFRRTRAVRVDCHCAIVTGYTSQSPRDHTQGLWAIIAIKEDAHASNPHGDANHGIPQIFALLVHDGAAVNEPRPDPKPQGMANVVA